MKWYEKTWFTWLMLFIFAPIGIILLWKYRTYSSKIKTTVTVIFAFLFLISIATDKTDKQIEQTPQQTITTETVTESQDVNIEQNEQSEPQQAEPPQQEQPIHTEQPQQVQEPTATPAQQVKQQSTTYIASAESDKFHKPRCRAAKKIDEANAIYFNSKDEAINAGYKPCGICKP